MGNERCERRNTGAALKGKSMCKGSSVNLIMSQGLAFASLFHSHSFVGGIFIEAECYGLTEFEAVPVCWLLLCQATSHLWHCGSTLCP